MTRTDRTHGEKYKERLWETYLNLTKCMNFTDFIFNHEIQATNKPVKGSVIGKIKY